MREIKFKYLFISENFVKIFFNNSLIGLLLKYIVRNISKKFFITRIFLEIEQLYL